MTAEATAGDTPTPDKRLTPAVVHAIEILALLRDRAPRMLNASEIARELQLSRASCHTIMQTLQRYHYVVQNPEDRRFTLGPALLGLAAGVAGDHHRRESARLALPKLAEETGLGANAYERAPGGHMALVARDNTSRPISYGLSIGIGFSIVVSPWWGALFLAWSSPAEIDRWFEMAAARGYGPRSDLERRAALEHLKQVADHGYEYAVHLLQKSEAGLSELEAWLARAAEVGLDRRSTEIQHAFAQSVDRMRDLPPEHGTPRNPGLPYPMVSVMAPVFNYDGEVDMAISVFGFAREIPPERVPALAVQVIACAGVITTAIGGRLRQALAARVDPAISRKTSE